MKFATRMEIAPRCFKGLKIPKSASHRDEFMPRQSRLPSNYSDIGIVDSILKDGWSGKEASDEIRN